MPLAALEPTHVVYQAIDERGRKGPLRSGFNVE